MKPSKLSMDVALAVIRAREARGWTQTAAAKRLGVTRNCLILIENAQRLPSFPVTVKLCKIFDFDITAFYDRVTEEDRHRDCKEVDTEVASLSSR